jgi:hypothetical protein
MQSTFRSGKIMPSNETSSHRRKGISADKRKRCFWKPFAISRQFSFWSFGNVSD